MLIKESVPFALAASLCLIQTANAAPGDLDSSFASAGKLDNLPACSYAIEAIPSSGGALFVVGKPNNGKAFFVSKYDADGQNLDSSFGTAGRAEMPLPSPYTSIGVMDAGVLADGKIAILGTVTNGSNPSDVYVAVLNSDGTPATAFSGDGVLVYQYNTSTSAKQDMPTTLQSLPDGRLLIGAKSDTSTTTSIKWGATLTRLNPNGTFDSTLAAQGRKSFYSGELIDMALAPDNSLFGLVRYSGSHLVKMPAPGTSTVDFGTSGRYALDLGTGLTTWAVATQSDGKVLVAGEKGDNAIIARFNPTGATPLDTTFGGGLGYVEIDSPMPEDYAAGVQESPNGEIVASGYSSNIGSLPTQDVLTFKLDTTGALVTSFGVNGFTGYDTAGESDRARSINVQSDDKILVASRSLVGGIEKCTVLRYLP